MIKHQDNNPSSSHHEDVIKLIPWYVKDKLTDPEKTVVMQHLSGCESCQQEVSDCETLLDSLPMAKDSWQPSASHFAGILANVNTLEADLTQEKSPHLVLNSSFFQRIQQLFAQTPRPVRWTLLAESLAFAFIAAFMVLPGQLSSDKTGQFETLSTVTSPATLKGRSIRLMLSEDMTTLELTELLKQAKAQIRQGPSEVGSFTIEVALDDEKQALSVLNTNPNVQLAQQIE